MNKIRSIDTPTYLLCNDVNSAPMSNRRLDDILHRLSYPYVTQQTQAILVPSFHLLHAILERAPDSRDFISMAESCSCKGAAYVTGRAKDLGYYFQISPYLGRKTLALGNSGLTIHTACFGRLPAVGGLQDAGSRSCDS